MATLFISAISMESESSKAGQEVGKEAMHNLGGKPHLGILFCSSDYSYSEVIQAVRKEVGADMPLVGCSSAGGFTEKQVANKAVVLALISSDSHRFYTGLGEKLKEGEMQALATACENFPKDVPGYPYFSAIIFLDGLVGMGEETVLAAANLFAEQVKFSGAAAADQLDFKQTKVFCGDQVYSDAVSLCFTASKNPVVIKVGHGHKPLTKPLMITKANKNILYEIEGRPAAEVWKEQLAQIEDGDVADKVPLDSKEFSRFLLKHEAGLVTRDGYKVRFPVSCNPDQSLNFVCTIREGAVIKIMGSKPMDQIASAAETAKAARHAAKGKKIAGAVVFDCACRGMILQEKFKDAVHAIKKELGDIPFIGLETYGEIGMEKGELSGFHNATTVILLIPE